MRQEKPSFPADVSLDKKRELLTQEQEIELAKSIASGSTDAQRILFESNIRLVHYFARRYRNNGLEYEDLVQEGYISLMRAVQNFDHTRGVRFASYAGDAIHNNLLVALAEKNALIYLPKHAYIEYLKLRQKIHDLMQSGSDYDDMEAVSKETGLSLQRIELLFNVTKFPLPLSARANQMNGDSHKPLRIEDILVSHEPDPDKEAIRHNLTEEVGRVLSLISPKSAEVITRHYGLDGAEPQSLRDLAKSMGLSKSYMWVLEQEGFEEIRRLPRTNLKIFLKD